MMNRFESRRFYRFDLRLVAILAVLVVQCGGLNTDGVLLLSFKYRVLNDPLRVLQSWHYADDTPCSWTGVTCGDSALPEPDRVTALALPSSQLLGSIPADLGMIQHLRILNLSNNLLNGSLPASIFDARELQTLDLSSNFIAGDLPDGIENLQSLQFLNLSDNALGGQIPNSLRNLRNLTTVSLKNNYISGSLPGGLTAVQVLDLSSNLINGSLPKDFGGDSLWYLNVSYNKLSGPIPSEFTEKIPGNATIDLSFNNLTGEIPESEVFWNQETSSFSGNPDLCGDPANSACSVTSSSPTSPPAIAAIPNLDSSPDPPEKPSRLRAGTIIGIVIGDIVGTAILSVIFLYVYKCKKNRTFEKEEASESGSESEHMTAWSCLRKGDSSDSNENGGACKQESPEKEKSSTSGTLVTFDGEKELELETLLKASAYILGATGSGIMYKAVLDDGTALAVRRIADNSVELFRNFESQVRVMAKLVHPNLVRVRGFYWGTDEKLIIYEYVSNGSLANARYRKIGSSPCHIPWVVRLKIIKGIARGLLYLHEKRHVHGNLKPSNILLGSDMEPKVGDFGLERLVTGDTSYKANTSTRNFGSKRSTASRDDHTMPSPSPSPSPSSVGCVSPYHAPESLRSLKPNSKWDVYAFGVILLELLTGKVVVLDDLGHGLGLGLEDKARVLRMADVAIRADLQGIEESLTTCFKLGYSCVSQAPQKRPQMREVVQVLDKIPCPYYYG